jgi:hypothetical protein
MKEKLLGMLLSNKPNSLEEFFFFFFFLIELLLAVFDNV